MQLIFFTISLFYYAFGIVAISFNLKNPIISERNPYLIYVIHLASFIAFELHFWELPCILVQILGRIIYFGLLLKAALYYSQCSTSNQFPKKLSRICWTNEHIIRLQTVLAMGIPFLALNMSIPISYYIMNGHLSSTCNIYPSAMVTISFYVTFIFMVYFTICINMNCSDYLNMRLELTLLTCASIIASTVYLCLKFRFKFEEYHNMYIQLMIFPFFASYFPLIVILFDRKHNDNKLLILNKTYTFRELYTVGREHHCEENIKFLDAYKKLIIGGSQRDLENIISRFIKKASDCQLNLSEELRNEVLQNPSCINLVYDQIVDLVRNNIIPFLEVPHSTND